MADVVKKRLIQHAAYQTRISYLVGMAVRSVSLVDKLEFDFQGTIYRHAIAFGDVDGDDENELAVCNTSGHLFLFKGKLSKPWRICNDDLGCITTIVVDDVTNCGYNSTLCLNTEGRCFIFSPKSVKEVENAKTGHVGKASNTKGAKLSPSHQSDILIKPSFVQDLPANPKMAIVADIDGDDQKEIVICYSDRFVRIFRYKPCPTLGIEAKPARDDLQESTSSIKKLSKQPSKDEDTKSNLSVLVKQPSKDSESSKTPSPRSPKNDDKTDGKQEFAFQFAEGKFEMLQEFYLPGQIGSVACVKCTDGYTRLVASQPAGGYAVLALYNPDSKDAMKQNSKVKEECIQISHLDIFYPSSGVGSRNFNVNCEVLGSLKRDHENSGNFGICTLDGHYALIDASCNGQRQRPTLRAADHQWFKMDKIETRDGDDAVAICSWDGMTHIIDRNFQSAAYNFGENICGFCAGSYCVEARKNVPCFCYVTFANRIILFYDLEIALEKPKSLDVVLVEKLKGRIGMEGVLAALSDSTGNIDHHKVLKLLQNVS